MGNKETVGSITDNLQSVLQGLGLKFDMATYEDEEENIPASKIPFGRIYYKGEEFEYNHKQKPGYVDVNYLVQAIEKERDARQMMSKLQKWVHLIRDSMTVDGLNIGDLATTKYISKVTMNDPEIENGTAISIVNYLITIRYREV